MPIIRSLLSVLGLQRKARSGSGPIPLSGYSAAYYDWTGSRSIPSPFADTTPWHLNPVVAAGINWYARNFPVPDLQVVKDGGSDDGTEIEDHWLVDLFDKPNELWSFFDFFAASVLSDLTDGNTFWLKRKDGTGEVFDLWWLDPWCVRIIPDPTRVKSVSRYEYHTGDVHESYSPEEIIHVRAAVPDRTDPRRGLASLAAADRSIRVTNEVARYDEAILKNGGASPGVFVPSDPTQPIPKDDIGWLQTWYRQNQTGPNAGGPIFAPFGLTWQQTGFSPEQLSLDKLPKRHVSFILAAIGLSPMVLGYEDESKTYANFGEAMKAAFDSLRAMQDRFAEAVNHDADLIAEGERLAWDYAQVPYMQEDRGSVIHSLAEAVGGGILTVDEARAELHYEPMPESEKPEEPPPPGEGDGAAPLADVASLLAERNGHSANGKPTKPAKALDEADLMERTDRVLAALETKLGGPGEVLDRGLDAAVADLKALYRSGQLSREETVLCIKAVREGEDRNPFDSKAKRRGKLTGGRWVTDDGGRRLYIRGGKVVAGRGMQARVGIGAKPKPGGGGGAAKPAEAAKPVWSGQLPGSKPAAKPVEAAKPAAKPVEAPKPTAKPVDAPKPVAKPTAAKPIGPVPDRYANAFDPKYRVAKPAGTDASPNDNARNAAATKGKTKSYTDPNKPATSGQDRAMHKAAADNFGDWEKGLSKDERNSLDHYAGLTGYQIVSGQLRSGQTHTAVPHLDSAIAKGELKEGTTLYRGFSGASRFGFKPGAGAVGHEFRDNGYHSTSMSAHVSSQFATGSDSALLRIRAPKGTKAAHVGTLGDKESEHEVLLPRGTGYKVVGYSRINDQHVYDVELI